MKVFRDIQKFHSIFHWKGIARRSCAELFFSSFLHKTVEITYHKYHNMCGWVKVFKFYFDVGEKSFQSWLHLQIYRVSVVLVEISSVWGDFVEHLFTFLWFVFVCKITLEKIKIRSECLPKFLIPVFLVRFSFPSKIKEFDEKSAFDCI